MVSSVASHFAYVHELTLFEVLNVVIAGCADTGIVLDWSCVARYVSVVC